VVIVGSIAGVAAYTAAAGVEVKVGIEGVYDHKKPTGQSGRWQHREVRPSNWYHRRCGHAQSGLGAHRRCRRDGDRAREADARDRVGSERRDRVRGNDARPQNHVDSNTIL